MNKKIFIVLLVLALVFAFSGCSTTNTTTTAPTRAFWTPAASVNKIVVISDIHLGIDDRYSETVENRQLLVDFLKKLEYTTDVRELIINGDFLDDWYLPLTYAKYDDPGKFYRQLIENNQNVFDALESLMAKGIKLVYVPAITICCLTAEF
jgi:hypothetical protein